MTLPWLIIGAGIHGMHAALQLTSRGGIRHNDLRVLDPHDEPLHIWNTTTRAVGMAYLRSPSVHNLHWDQGSLNLYARIKQRDHPSEFIAPFARPSLDLFNAHSEHVIGKYSLDTLLDRGRALRLVRAGSAWAVETDRGVIHATNVVLALGRSDQPAWPDWARPHRDSGQVCHAFESKHRPPADDETVAVVGGGLTAVQIATYLAAENLGRVVLIHRAPFRMHDFDADVGWMNSINLRGFARTPNWDDRRQIIIEARHRGSVTFDMAERLTLARETGAIEVVQSEVNRVDSTRRLMLHTDSGPITADRIILATGYDRFRPGGTLIDTLIQEHGLQIASDGFPVLDPTLCWARGLFVMGSLAELQVGPAANNIIGARLAAQRILAAL